MDDGALNLALSMMAPGALIGLVLGLKHGLDTSLANALLGGAGGYLGAYLLTDFMSSIDVTLQLTYTVALLGGSVFGALALLFAMGRLQPDATGG